MLGDAVLRFSRNAAAADEAEDAEDSKVIVRSNGTVTYVGKDIAYQLWKFGLLGKDFYYQPWTTYPDGHQVWVTTDQPGNATSPAFGHASQVFNVIDSRQSYLQDVVVAGLRALDFQKQADASIHFSYEMVALTPRTCVEMGIQLSDEDKKKAYVEVSGRKGLGVKADDLLDKLIETALGGSCLIAIPKPLPPIASSVAEMIAVGALRYFMLKFTRNSVIAFDFHEALSFEGETGPYVQYATVRAGNILKKFTDRGDTLPAFDKVLNRDIFARCSRIRRSLATCSCWPPKPAARSSAPSRPANPRTWPSTHFNSRKASIISITNIMSSPKRTPNAAPCFFGSPPTFVSNYSKRWQFWAFNSPLTCEENKLKVDGK